MNETQHNEPCLTCGGQKYTGGSDQLTTWMPCPECQGTGKAPEAAKPEAEGDEVLQAIEAAHDMVDQLCHGRRWIMRVPVQESDPDIVITKGLMAAKVAYLASKREVEKLVAAIERERKALKVYEPKRGGGWVYLRQVNAAIDRIIKLVKGGGE